MIEWILATLSIAGAILNIVKNRWGFIIWIVANIGWIVVDVIVGLWEQIPIWVVYTILSVYGFIIWTKEEKQDDKHL